MAGQHVVIPHAVSAASTYKLLHSRLSILYISKLKS